MHKWFAAVLTTSYLHCSDSCLLYGTLSIIVDLQCTSVIRYERASWALQGITHCFDEGAWCLRFRLPFDNWLILRICLADKRERGRTLLIILTQFLVGSEPNETNP